MKNIAIVLALALLSLNACQPDNKNDVQAPEGERVQTDSTIAPVFDAVVETPPVLQASDDDAADDPAFWYNAGQPEMSRIVGAHKKYGIEIYTLKGQRVADFPVGRINNIDIRQQIVVLGDTIDILGGSNRTYNTIDLYTIAQDTIQQQLSHPVAGLQEVYGFSLYRPANEQNVYALVNDKTGNIQQWKIAFSDTGWSVKLHKSYTLPGQVEGMVADDQNSRIFVGMEEGGIYVFNQGASQGQLIAESTAANPAIAYDIEGLALYGGDQGYLIASSQGNNTFAVFRKSPPYSYLGSFAVAYGKDTVAETDGIEAITHAIGTAFPKGIFICQDGYNYQGDSLAAQNFKVVDGRDIAGAW